MIGVAVLILSFLPMANVLFPVGTLVGERLLYIPSAGALSAVVCLAHLHSLHHGSVATWRRSVRQQLPAAGLVAVGAAFVLRCAYRIPEWADADTITVADGYRQPRSTRVQFNFANVHLQAKRYDEALFLYNRVLAIDPKERDAMPLHHAGQILLFRGQHAEASAYLSKAVAGYYSPLTAFEEEIWHDYALSLWFVDQPMESVLNFQRALALKPGFAKALNNFACAAGLGAFTGRLPQEWLWHALQALEQALAKESHNLLYWRNAASLLALGGDHQASAAAWEQVRLLNPEPTDPMPPRDCAWEFYFR